MIDLAWDYSLSQESFWRTWEPRNGTGNSCDWCHVPISVILGEQRGSISLLTGTRFSSQNGHGMYSSSRYIYTCILGFIQGFWGLISYFYTCGLHSWPSPVSLYPTDRRLLHLTPGARKLFTKASDRRRRKWLTLPMAQLHTTPFPAAEMLSLSLEWQLDFPKKQTPMITSGNFFYKLGVQWLPSRVTESIMRRITIRTLTMEELWVYIIHVPGRC